MTKSPAKTFEDCSDEIDQLIRKQRNRWQLDAINWMDFEDVVQIVKIHIVRKWGQWDQTRPLAPWVSRVTANQIRNLVRNNYLNYALPCATCGYNLGENVCGITRSGRQDAECPLYSKWKRSKKAGYNLKIPVALEHHSHELRSKAGSPVCLEEATVRLNREMQKALSEKHFRAYCMLFFEESSAEDVASFMGYTTTEENRPIGYKQVKNLAKAFKKTAIEILAKHDIILGLDDSHS